MSTKDPPPDGSLRVSTRILKKKGSAKEQPAAVFPLPSCTEEPTLSKAALKQRRYRERLKEKGLWNQYREKQNKTIKNSKSKMSVEQKELAKEQGRVRSQRYRDNRKEQGLPANPLRQKVTRKAAEDKRVKDRARQQKYRAEMTSQKKKWINKKRREKQAAKKATLSTPPQPALSEQATPSAPSPPALSVPSTPSPLTPRGYTSKSALRKASKYVKTCLPKSPTKFAAVIDSLTNIKSPRKRAAMENLGIRSSKARKLDVSFIQQEVEQTCLKLKKARSMKARQRVRNACRLLLKSSAVPKSHLRKKLGISWNTLVKASTSKDDDDVVNKKRADALSEQTVDHVHKYFSQGDISWEDPSPATVSAKTFEPTRFMEKTLKETYDQFQKESGTRMSFSKFASLKPKGTKTVAHNKIRACKCEYCANVDLKIEAINKFLGKHGHNTRLGSKYELMTMTTCGLHQVRQVPEKKCIDRECEECGVKSLRQQLQQELEDSAHKPVTWVTWKLVEQTFQNRQGVDGTTTKRGPVTEEGTFDQLVTKLEENLTTFALHLTNAQWQHRQFASITEKLPEKWVVMCIDFGENFTCYFQDEAQSAHWGKQQVTIHPIVTYFTCPEDGELMKESFIFISDDLNHDSHAAQYFVTKVLDVLVSRGVVILKMIHFSDGCASQYKGKIPFVDASYSSADFSIQTEKHYFGSRHRKGPCDAEIGVVKRMTQQDNKKGKAHTTHMLDLDLYMTLTFR